MGETERQKKEEMGIDMGTQRCTKAGAVSPPCPAPCAGVSSVAVLAERCLTPVLGDGEGRGIQPGGSVPAKASLSQDEILLGVHEPNLPSSGFGDHCRGTHEAAAARGGPWHGGCVAAATEAKPRVLLLYSRGPKKLVVPGVTLLWSVCIAGSQQPTLPASWCSPEAIPAGCARTRTHDMVQLLTVMQQGLENRSASCGHESNFFTVTL